MIFLTFSSSSALRPDRNTGDQFLWLSYHQTKYTANRPGVVGMNKRLLAASVGIGAGALLIGVYVSYVYFGGKLPPEATMVGTAAIVLASAVALFMLVALERPRYGTSRTLKFNEEPAVEYIFPFKGENIAQIYARPDTSLAAMLARFGDSFQKPAAEMAKEITVTLKGSRKMPFATITLQQLFLTLKPFRLEHVLLLTENDHFIGYLPGKRASKEFTGDNGAEKITKYIVKVFEKPDDAGIIREIGGVPDADTVKESDDLNYAERMLWANEAISGLVVKRKSAPVGYISKVDVLRLNAGRS
jgi:hypothetical protein